MEGYSVAELDAIASTDVRENIPEKEVSRALNSDPFIPIRLPINARDLGKVSGSRIAPNRIFRCGNFGVGEDDPAGIAWVQGNVRRVFDLRTARECLSMPSPEIPGVERVWREREVESTRLRLEEFVEGDGSEGWGIRYLETLLFLKPIYAEVFRHIRDRPNESFMFHCTAGRDRTGVLAALIQTLAGEDRQTMVHDYMLSRIGIEPAREMLTGFAAESMAGGDAETPGFWNMVNFRPQSMTRFLEKMGEEYEGGCEGYLRDGLGFSEEDVEKIKENLRR